MSFDRSAILATAEKARIAGKTGKAIAAYRKVLEREPQDANLHAKLAPLLAKKGRLGEAWNSFTYAAKDMVGKGFLDKALGLYQHAATFLPQEPEVWERIAELHLGRGRRPDAITNLLKGARQLPGRSGRQTAIRLLRRAVEIEPNSLEANLDLAIALRKDGFIDEPKALLDGLVPRITGRLLRRVRWQLFHLGPTPGAFFRWLRAVFRGI